MKTALFALTALLLVGCGTQEPQDPEVFASPYNATLECWEEMQPTGKFAPQDGCNSAIYYVVDEDKQVWMLFNSCGKDEFTPVSPEQYADIQPCQEGPR